MSIYINQNPQFCVYLTIYSGTKLPPFYIGSGTISKIKNKNNPYRGTVVSKKYKSIWRQELKENPHLFRTIILYKFYSRKNATYHERLLQIQFNVVRSDKFINMAIASKNFADGTKQTKESNIKRSISMKGENHWNYGKKYSEETKEKQSISAKNRPPPTEETKDKISTSLKGKFVSEETRELMSKANTGANNPSAKIITIDGITYGCKKDACESLGISWKKLNKILDLQNN